MKITTKNGYGFFEATSAFQKSIRRCDEPVALYFMTEFFNSGYDEYIWKRMKIICSEDIGLAEPQLPAQLHALYQFYSELKKENKDNKPERLYLTHAVLLLVRAKKSRLADLMTAISWRGHDEVKMEMPDYAYDMHNVKGKQMGRGIDHFFKEGAKCNNFTPQEGEREAEKEALYWFKKVPGKLSFRGMKKGNGSITQQHTMFEDE